MRFQQRPFWVASGLFLSILCCAIPGNAAEPLDQQLDMRSHREEQLQLRQLAEQLVLDGNEAAEAGDTDAAIAAWTQATDLFVTLGDDDAIDQLNDRLAQAYVKLERYDELEGVLLRRLVTAQDTDDVAGQITGLNNLGTIHLYQREMARARALFEEALQIAEASTNRAGIGLSLSNLGLIAWSQNDLATARTYYEEAANYRLIGDDDVGLAHSTNNLGLIYSQLGLEGKALGAFRMARRLSMETGHVPTLVTALDGLIDIYRDRGELTMVQEYIAERVALSNGPGSPPERQLGLFVRLGEYYEQTGDLIAAEDAYQQALTLARQLADTTQQAYITNRLQALPISAID